jgi:hypothetical protein
MLKHVHVIQIMATVAILLFGVIWARFKGYHTINALSKENVTIIHADVNAKT